MRVDLLIFGFLISLVLALGGGNIYLMQKNDVLSAKLATSESLLELQTQQIEQIALDTKIYTCDIHTLDTYTKQKYSKIIHDEHNQTCEAKLENLERALDIFNE